MRTAWDIKLYLLISIVSSMDLTRGIFTLFLASRGVSPVEIGILQTTLFWTSLLLDVPAGVFADRHRRRSSLALGLSLVGISALLMPFSTGLLEFVALFSIQGVGFAFRSGAGCAWLFDRVSPGAADKEALYLGISAKCSMLSNLALAIAVFAGPWLRGRDWSGTYFAFGALMLSASLLCLALPEPTHRKGKERSSSLLLIRSIRTFCGADQGQRLLAFIGITAFLEAAHTPLFIYMQLKLREICPDARWVGFAVALALGFSSFALRWVPRLETLPLRQKLLLALLSTSALILILARIQAPALAILLFCLANAIPTVLFVFTDKVVQDGVPSHIRASFLSVHSTITSVVIGLSYLGAGVVIGRLGVDAGIGLLGLFPLISVVAIGLVQEGEWIHGFS